MYDRVLIAVDGSEGAERAARRGVRFADGFDAAVDVLHVVERKSLGLAKSDDEASRLRKRGREIVADVEELAAASGTKVTTAVVEGEPAAEICEHAARRDASPIVLGRRGLSGLRDRLFGGVTERVLHHSDVPVLVVPGDDRVDPGDGYGRVLLPTDGSENAASAAGHAAAVCRQYDGTVRVLNVVDLQSAGGVFDAGGVDESFRERLEERGRDAVAELRDELGESHPDVAVETDVVKSSSLEGVANGIHEYAADRAVGLIVMGSHGRSNLRRQLLGSVAASLVGTADVPVLIVPRAERSDR